MGKLQTSDFILNKPIVDEVGYCFWMRLNAVCGGWDFPTGAKTGVSRVAARRGFYSHGLELEGGLSVAGSVYSRVALEAALDEVRIISPLVFKNGIF
jgi:hypothetical protein